MDKTGSNPSLSDGIAKKKPKEQKNLGERLLSASGFYMQVGLLVMMFGFILFMGFRKQYTKLLLVIGLIVFLFSFLLKMIEIVIKLMGKRP